MTARVLRVMAVGLANVAAVVAILLVAEGFARFLFDDEFQPLFSNPTLRTNRRPFVEAHARRGFALKPAFASGTIKINRVCEAFECGKVQNPANLLSQVQGGIIMGLGGALTEEMTFEKGQILNPSLNQYHVPHFRDVPPLDIHLLDRPDLPSVGGGETPIIAVAPAIANAVCDATGVRIRAMPIRGAAIRKT